MSTQIEISNPPQQEETECECTPDATVIKIDDIPSECTEAEPDTEPKTGSGTEPKQSVTTKVTGVVTEKVTDSINYGCVIFCVFFCVWVGSTSGLILIGYFEDLPGMYFAAGAFTVLYCLIMLGIVWPTNSNAY